MHFDLVEFASADHALGIALHGFELQQSEPAGVDTHLIRAMHDMGDEELFAGTRGRPDRDLVSGLEARTLTDEGEIGSHRLWNTGRDHAIPEFPARFAPRSDVITARRRSTRQHVAFDHQLIGGMKRVLESARGGIAQDDLQPRWREPFGMGCGQ
ncbi:MAG: hypothetical protein WDO12_06550 [Pseudomonadota bacterium]